MTRGEIRDFQENPYHRAAVWLRRIDDRACDPARTDMAGLEHHREHLETALRSRQLALESARRKGGFVRAHYCQTC